MPVGPEKGSILILLHILGWCSIPCSMIPFILRLLKTSARSWLSLQTENAALRHQLSVYRHSGQRPRVRPEDRLLWPAMSRLWSGWRTALYFVQPRTVTTWQKKRFSDYWRALS